MKIAYLDAFSGISGDMTVGALIDAGAPADSVMEALLSMNARVSVERVKRGGVAASKFRVENETGAGHRHLPAILDMIAKARIGEKAKRDASAVFTKLGEAEARVHGVAIEKVHFHEVGAMDSIADIVGACVALELLAVDELRCSFVNVGSGTVKTEHGVLPVPAPAAASLLQGVPIYSRGPSLELTTPTGAAIVATLAAGFGAMPAMRIAAIGYGAGEREFPEHPNVLRVMIGESTRAPQATLVSLIEANVDDVTGEVLGHAIERLMEAGALDASLSPLLMKKGRPGSWLRVIAKPEDQERLAQLILAETSTLGLQIHAAERRVVERSMTTVETEFGTIRMKISENGFKPEYEDCRAIVARTGTPLPKVIAAANLAYLKQTR
jgi:hypothetical protein